MHTCRNIVYIFYTEVSGLRRRLEKIIIINSQATTSPVRRQVPAPVERRRQRQRHVRVLGQDRLERGSCGARAAAVGAGAVGARAAGYAYAAAAAAAAAASAAIAAIVVLVVVGHLRRRRRRRWPLRLRSLVPSTGRFARLTAAATAVAGGRRTVPRPLLTVSLAPAPAAGGPATATTATAVHVVVVCGGRRLEKSYPFAVGVSSSSESLGRGRAVGTAVRLGHAHHIILCRVGVSVTTIIYRTDIILFWYRYRYVTGVRVLCRRQCVSTGRPNATAMRLPPYVLHSRGFYRGKTPPAPPTPSDRYVGRRCRSAGRRKSFGPEDADAGAQSHPPLECWPLARVRVRRAIRVYVCVYGRFIRTHFTCRTIIYRAIRFAGRP